MIYINVKIPICSWEHGRKERNRGVVRVRGLAGTRMCSEAVLQQVQEEKTDAVYAA